MEQELAKIFRYIPEWVFVLILISLVVVFVFFDNPLTTVCDTQIADFTQGQTGKLFPRAVQVLDPLTGGPHFENVLAKNRKQCIGSINGAGCYGYFKTVQSVLDDFKKLKNQCLMELSQKGVIKILFDDYLSTITRLAWGESPPKSQFTKKGWLSDLELKTFCQVKKYYNVFYTPKDWDDLTRKTLSELVIEPKDFQKVEQTKKEIFDQEVQEEKEYVFEKAVMEYKKAYDLSLLTFDCLYYQ